MDRDDASLDRRAFLATLGVGLLAGCTGGPEDTPRAPTSTPTATAGTGAQPTTPSATATESPTATPEEGTPEPRPLDGTWTAYGYDLGNTGVNPDTGPVTGRDVTWAKPVGGNNTLPEPVVTGDAVYVASDTSMYAVDRAAGTRKWTTDLEIPTYFYTPAVGDSTLYAVGRGLGGAFEGNDRPGVLAALDHGSGEVAWRREAFVTASPVLRDGLVYYAAATADRGSIHAVAAADGTDEWSFTFGGGDAPSGSFGTPAFGPERLYATGTVGGEDDASGRVVALDPASGGLEWRFRTDAPVELAPVYSDGQVFYATEAGRLACVDADTQGTVWEYAFEDAPVSKPSVGNGLVYALANDVVTALDRADGSVVWAREVGPVQSTITVTGDAVYVGGDTLDAFDATTGERRWQRTIDGYAGAYGVPVAVDEYIYVGACVKESEGSLYDNYVYQLG